MNGSLTQITDIATIIADIAVFVGIAVAYVAFSADQRDRRGREAHRRIAPGLRSYSEPMIDTTDASPMGNLLLNILAAVAEFERGLIAERVRAGMARARKQGKPVGRAPVLDGNLDALIPAISAGTLSRRQAARQLGVSHSTVSRTLVRKARVKGAPLGRENPASANGAA